MFFLTTLIVSLSFSLVQEAKRRLEAENRKLEQENQVLAQGGAPAGPSRSSEEDSSSRGPNEASRELEEEAAGSLQSRRCGFFKRSSSFLQLQEEQQQ